MKLMEAEGMLIEFTEQEREIIAAGMDLLNAIYSLEDKKKRDTWCLTFAGDFLHDLDDDLRNKFFKEYTELREAVKIICGDS